MRDNQDRGLISFRTFTVIAAAIILTIAVFAWENIAHVPINSGPSGIPGSTALDRTPPAAAEDLSGRTTGKSR